MPFKNPDNHKYVWDDLIANIKGISWFKVAYILYNKQHAYSIYKYCKSRDHHRVRRDVYKDQRVLEFIASNDDNRQKVERVLDEMSHLLDSQTSPSRKLKWAGVPFLKCITEIYSNVYVNNHLLPIEKSTFGDDLFKKQYLEMSGELPIVILPTHRSYMDFLFITFILFSYELPLPIVAAGDNFKAMGKILCDYLKQTGAFLVRRNAAKKSDIEAAAYFDILRAYVHSIICGGENPLEFFMEGTRTRGGQVLHPKTGLLSMVVDMYLDKSIEDVFIMPVSINYQRPIEEQLYVSENTPQIGMQKPTESAKNLLKGFEAIMKRRYGKVYVRFIEPFKLSQAFNQWTNHFNIKGHNNGNRSRVLHNFTKNLASRICLDQAYNNVLMPIHLLSCSLMSRAFLSELEGSGTGSASDKPLGVPISEIIRDFLLLEEILKVNQQYQFLPGWGSNLDILEEFKIDRDGIIRSNSARTLVELDNNARTFHTLQYYSNQTIQMLLPVAICIVIIESRNMVDRNSMNSSQWDQYKFIRHLLSWEFLEDEQYLATEFENGLVVAQCERTKPELKTILVRHLVYVIQAYVIFLQYLKYNCVFEESEFFNRKRIHDDQPDVFISKDMVRNMASLSKDMVVCEPLLETNEKPSQVSGISETTSHKAPRFKEKLKVIDSAKLELLLVDFHEVLINSKKVVASLL